MNAAFLALVSLQHMMIDTLSFFSNHLLSLFYSMFVAPGKELNGSSKK